MTWICSVFFFSNFLFSLYLSLSPINLVIYDLFNWIWEIWCSWRHEHIGLFACLYFGVFYSHTWPNSLVRNLYSILVFPSYLGIYPRGSLKSSHFLFIHLLTIFTSASICITGWFCLLGLNWQKCVIWHMLGCHCGHLRVFAMPIPSKL